MSQRPEGYIPAAGRDWLLPLYDPLVKLLFREEEAKRQLLEQADLCPGHRVLDVGCGTGTLLVLVKGVCPEAHVVGLDGDPKALAVARRKTDRAGAEAQLDEGLSYDLPYPDASFDRVLSSFVLHHLTPEHKQRTLAEILRVLAPGGSFHLLDFGRPVGAWDRVLAHLAFHSSEGRDHVEGRLATRLSDAGFAPVEELARRGTLVGSAWYYRATKPVGSRPAP